MVSEGTGQYIKSVSKLLSCWHISLMEGLIQPTAVLTPVRSSFAGANMHGALWGGFSAHLSQDMAPHLGVYCLLKFSLVCEDWLYWPPDWCLWLQHKVGGLLLPSIAQLVLPRETWISAVSCREAQSVIYFFSFFFFSLFQHFVEVLVRTRVLQNPYVVLAVLTDNTSLWLSAAFWVPQVAHLIKRTHLSDGCSNESTVC